MLIRIVFLLCYFSVNAAAVADDVPWSKLALKIFTIDAQFASFTPNSQHLIFANDGEILFYSLQTRKIERMAKIQPSKDSHSSNYLAMNKAGSMMATTSITTSGETIVLWNFPDVELAGSWLVTTDALAASFSADGRLLATGALGNDASAEQGYADVWDIPTGHKIQMLAIKEGPIASLSFNIDTTLLAISSANHVDLWSAIDWKKVQTLRGDSAIFSPDGRYLACTVNVNGKSGINLWDIRNQQWLWSNPIHEFTASVKGIGFSPDSKYVASVGRETIVSNIGAQEQVYKFPVKATTLAFSNDGRWLVLINAMESTSRKIRSNVYIYSATDGSAVFKTQ
jgi:WD40 repeat protein